MDYDEMIDNIGEEGVGIDPNEELSLFENDTISEYKMLKDIVIFLIDCNEKLLFSGFNNILETAQGFLKTKIITNENDLFGLILYNINTPSLQMDMQDSNVKYNELKFEGVNVLIKPCPPDAGLIKKVKNLSDKSNPTLNKDHKQFLLENFPSSKKEISLNDALWICQTEFKNFDAKNFNRRIFLFTENDNPMVNDHNERMKTLQRGKDMLESDIILELFPMSVNRPFDMKKFFSDIIPQNNEDLILTRENCMDRIKELNKRIRQKEFKKRRLGKCPFFLTKDVKVLVNIYSSLRKAVKPTSHFIEAKNNKQLALINNMICKDTGAILYPNQIGTYHIYGGYKVVFTKEDMKNIKNIDNYGMKLMGFKDKTSIKPYYNIRSSYFIYPDENLTEGASELFDALIKQLLAKDKVAIVKFISREGTTVRFCALYPQKEMFDEDLFQTPPGFNLVFLPYADDIRSLDEIIKKQNIEAENLNADQFEAAKKLIKRMNFDFDSRNFENPTLQNFYATLQALALGESKIEEVEDLLRPDPEGLKNLNGVDIQFRKLCFGDTGGTKKATVDSKNKARNKSEEKSDDNKLRNVSKKKKAGDNLDTVEEEKESKGKNNKRKKIDKTEEPSINEENNIKYDEGYSDRVILKMLEIDGLNSLTVPKLKDILNERKISFQKSTKKAELLEILHDYLFKNMK